ncbi:glycosyltransferase, partial [Candidatus Fermentibacteria bacterium]|nr:glycosyltransferase [Candidatus Fermentibacteria bacterium]
MTEGRESLRIVISNSMMTWGGGENWSLTAASGLAERGHDVVLVCRPGSELERRASGCSPARVRTIGIRGDLNPAVVASGIGLFRRHRTQLACCNLDREVRTLGLAARLAGGIVFVRRRGSDYGFKNSLRYRLTYRWLVDWVIVNSLSTRNSILRKNSWISAERLRLVYNGIDTERFRPDRPAGEAVRANHAVPGDALLVGIVGSLLPRKRHSVLFEACASLRSRWPSLRVAVVGSSPSPGHLSRLRRLAETLGIGDIVIFAGQTGEPAAWYNALDILAMPSENEGFGYAAAEAMACGVPVVVSDASSLPEVAGTDGSAGLISRLDDPAGLKACI